MDKRLIVTKKQKELLECVREQPGEKLDFYAYLCQTSESAISRMAYKLSSMNLMYRHGKTLWPIENDNVGFEQA